MKLIFSNGKVELTIEVEPTATFQHLNDKLKAAGVKVNLLKLRPLNKNNKKPFELTTNLVKYFITQPKPKGCNIGVEKLPTKVRYCRLCSKPISRNPSYIFQRIKNPKVNDLTDELNFDSEDDITTLADKMNAVFPFTVSTKDTLPKQICPDCVVSLNRIYNFHEQVKVSQVLLELSLDKKELDKDHIDCPLCDGPIKPVNQNTRKILPPKSMQDTETEQADQLEYHEGDVVISEFWEDQLIRVESKNRKSKTQHKSNLPEYYEGDLVISEFSETYSHSYLGATGRKQQIPKTGRPKKSTTVTIKNRRRWTPKRYKEHFMEKMKRSDDKIENSELNMGKDEFMKDKEKPIVTNKHKIKGGIQNIEAGKKKIQENIDRGENDDMHFASVSFYDKLGESSLVTDNTLEGRDNQSFEKNNVIMEEDGPRIEEDGPKPEEYEQSSEEDTEEENDEQRVAEDLELENNDGGMTFVPLSLYDCLDDLPYTRMKKVKFNQRRKKASEGIEKYPEKSKGGKWKRRGDEQKMNLVANLPCKKLDGDKHRNVEDQQRIEQEGKRMAENEQRIENYTEQGKTDKNIFRFPKLLDHLDELPDLIVEELIEQPKTDNELPLSSMLFDPLYESTYVMMEEDNHKMEEDINQGVAVDHAHNDFLNLPALLGDFPHLRKDEVKQKMAEGVEQIKVDNQLDDFSNVKMHEDTRTGMEEDFEQGRTGINLNFTPLTFYDSFDDLPYTSMDKDNQRTREDSQTIAKEGKSMEQEDHRADSYSERGKDNNNIPLVSSGFYSPLQDLTCMAMEENKDDIEMKDLEEGATDNDVPLAFPSSYDPLDDLSYPGKKNVKHIIAENIPSSYDLLDDLYTGKDKVKGIIAENIKQLKPNIDMPFHSSSEYNPLDELWTEIDLSYTREIEVKQEMEQAQADYNMPCDSTNFCNPPDDLSRMKMDTLRIEQSGERTKEEEEKRTENNIEQEKIDDTLVSSNLLDPLDELPDMMAGDFIEQTKTDNAIPLSLNLFDPLYELTYAMMEENKHKMEEDIDQGVADNDIMHDDFSNLCDPPDGFLSLIQERNKSNKQ